MKPIRLIRPLFALPLFLGSTTTYCAEDWPTQAHDNHRSGVTSERLVPSLSLKWSYKPLVPPALGWPRNVDGYGAHMHANKVNYDDAYRVVASEGVACFSVSGENRVYAVNTERGEVLWTLELDAAPRLAPTIWKGRIYVVADDGRVRCLDLKTGKAIWSFTAAPSERRVLGIGALCFGLAYSCRGND